MMQAAGEFKCNKPKVSIAVVVSFRLFFCLFIAQFLIKYGQNKVRIISARYVKVAERGWVRQCV
jgi:hypothetical protein